MDTIELRQIPVHCIIGVNPEERTKAQCVQVDVTLEFDVSSAARYADLRCSIDYAEIALHLQFILTESKFLLLESACSALCAYLLAPPCPAIPRAQVERVTVSICKPDALPQGCPVVTLCRDRKWLQIEQETKPFGNVDIIFETPHMGLYRLHVASGKSIPLHIHRTMDESELILSDEILCQGQPVRSGTIHRWDKNEAHVYTNPSANTQSILCIDRPPFIESDEIVLP